MRPWDIRKFREYRGNGHTMFTSVVAAFPAWMMLIVLPIAFGIPLSLYL